MTKNFYDGLSLTRWKKAFNYTKGRSHIKSDIPCQDYTNVLVNKNISVAALADGAGSCSCSDIGAKIVVDTVISELNNRFDYYYDLCILKLKKELINIIKDKIWLEAKPLNKNIKDFSSTLLFIAIKDNRYIMGHIGDGVIGCLMNEHLHVLSEPNNGEFINSTFFVTDKDAKTKMKIKRNLLSEIDGFVLMSDGSTESLYDKKKSCLSKGVYSLLSWLVDNSEDEIQQALKYNMENIISKKTMDDCSIALLKKVSYMYHEFIKKNKNLQMEFLNMGNMLGVNNRLNVFKEVKANKSISFISKKYNITEETIQKHINYLIKSELINENEV